MPKVTSSEHKAESSRNEVAKPRDPKYTKLKWCPSGITKTQKRKLQRARNREKVEKEAEQARDAEFNAERPMVSAQVWVPKPNPPKIPLMITPSSAVNSEAGPVSVPATAYSSWADEVEAADFEVEDKPATAESDNESANGDSVEDSAGKELAGNESELTINDSENPTDEELLDHESTPTRVGMDINMVYYLPAEFRAVEEEAEVAQLNFGPKNAIFEKPEGPVKHLKPLYVRGYQREAGYQDDG